MHNQHMTDLLGGHQLNPPVSGHLSGQGRGWYLAVGVEGERAIILEAPAPLLPRWYTLALHMPPLVGPLSLPGSQDRRSWLSAQASKTQVAVSAM